MLGLDAQVAEAGSAGAGGVSLGACSPVTSPGETWLSPVALGFFLLRGSFSNGATEWSLLISSAGKAV